jgi:hypothetical protein
MVKKREFYKMVLWATFSALLSGLWFPLATALAGTGTCDASSSPAVVDITVYFSYPETDSNLTNVWKPQFQELSNRIFTATGSQLRLRKVKAYVRDETHRSDADVIVGRRGPGLMTANAHMGALGGTGRLFIDHKFGLPTAQRPWADTRSVGLILVHEWGHYHFNLGDEYTGQSVPAAKSNTWVQNDLSGNGNYGNCVSNAFTCCGVSTGANHNWSIMAGPRAVTGVTGGWPLGFCDSTWDNAGVTSGGRFWLTHQQFRWNLQDNDHAVKDCWTIMKRLRASGNLVFDPNTTVAYPASLATAPDIDWEVKPTMSRMMLCVDRSGSMSSELKIEYAKAAATMFVAITAPQRDLSAIEAGLVQEADWVGVVDFDDAVTTTFPLSKVNDWTTGTKANAITAISGLYDRGMTAIGDGLQQCRSEHLRVDDPNVGGPASGRIVVLLSDGQDNSSSIDPLTAAQNCKASDIRVYTVGLGSDVDAALMSGIASATDGRYRFAGSASALAGVFLDFLGEFKGGLRSNTSHTLPAGSSMSRAISTDELSDTAEFVLASDESSNLTFTLQSPSGAVYSGSDPNANITFVDISGNQFFRVVAPEVGNWNVTVEAPAGTGDNDFQLATFSASPLLDVKCDLNKSDYVYGQDLPLLTCLVSAGQAVGGVSVTAEITKPDGIIETVILYDDGSDSHGDKEANDGIYSAYYPAIYKDGAYSIRFHIVNETGYTVGLPFENWPGAPSQDSQPVSGFEREQAVSFNVTGAPTILEEWLRVDRVGVKVNTKKAGQDSITMQGEFNALQGNVDLLTNGATIQAEAQPGGVYSSTLLPANFKAGRGGKYTYKDKTTGTNAAFLLGRGGSTRSKYAFKANKQNILGVMLTDDVNDLIVTMQSNNFQEQVDIVPTNIRGGVTFRMPQNFYRTPCMFVDALIINRITNQTNKDKLRATIRYEAGTPFNANTDTLALAIDQLLLQISPNDWTKKSKNNQILTYSAKAGAKKITLKMDTVKRQISLNITNDNLSDSVISATPLVHLAYGSFDWNNVIGLSTKTVKTKQTLLY